MASSIKYYYRYMERGLCVYGPSHGPATQGILCEACWKKYGEKRTTSRRKNSEKGLCVYAESHGTATRGSMCAKCADYYVKHVTYQRKWNREHGLCVNGTSHGETGGPYFCPPCREKQRELYHARKAKLAGVT
jgi:hypothetical protein